MILGDSILQTASMVRWISAGATDTHHTRTFGTGVFLGLSSVLRGREQLADLGLTLPAWPVLVMKFHETPGSLDRLLRFQFKNCIPAEDFLGLGERSVGDGNFSARQPDA